jgi:hypothetical protein
VLLKALGDVIKLRTRGDNQSMKTISDEGTRAMVAAELNSRSRPFSKTELWKDSRPKVFERIEQSASLAMTYPRVKALKMNLLYFDCEIVSWGQSILYRANLETAKSILHFNCPSSLCQGGGFDLSDDLWAAVTGRRKSIVGVRHCHGSRDEKAGKTLSCKSVLHFKMTLVLKPRRSSVSRAGAVRKTGLMRNRSQS